MNDGKWNMTWSEVELRLAELQSRLQGRTVWGVPRGGAIIAGLARHHGALVVSTPEIAEVILDDLVDSGATRLRWKELWPAAEFITLVDKPREGLTGTWIHFPWEEESETDIEDHIRRIIEFIGDDPSRPDLVETPSRVVKAWKELFSGYTDDARLHLKSFASDSTGWVTLNGIEFASTCEHHMLPFTGTADISYLPGGHVIGVSKLARLVDAKSRKLQIQERLTKEIGETLWELPGIRGVVVTMRGQHSCMSCRGVNQRHTEMVTRYSHGEVCNDR